MKERNGKTSARSTCRIKVSFWDCTIRQEGHKAHLFFCSSSSSLGRAVITVQCCIGLNNTQGVLQSGGETCPLFEKRSLFESPNSCTLCFDTKEKKNLTNRCVRGLAGFQLLFDANVHQTQTGQDLPEELAGSLRESPALSLQELRALGNN